MKDNFVYKFNDLEIRKCTRGCFCKVCDEYLIDKDIVYLRSFRLNSQPFHICLDCWKKINLLVDDYIKQDFKR